MAGQVFTQTLGDDDGPQFQPAPEDLQALQAIRDRANSPAAPRFTPEQVAKRQADNQRQYALGALAMMSNNEDLQQQGAVFFKQALADRTPHITEHGSSDQLSGEFTYDPDYLQQRNDDQTNAVLNRIGAQRVAFQNARAAAKDRAAAAAQAAQSHEDAIRLGASLRPPPQQPLVAIIGSDGQPVLVPRSDASGKQPVPPGGNAKPSEDQGKAAGWVNQATLAYQTMQDAIQKDPEAAKPGKMEMGLGALPKVGRAMSYAAMSPQRQRFASAASSFSEAVLRAATGAGVNHDEAVQKVEELTPRWGEDQVSINDKQARTVMYLQSLATRAGNAPNVLNQPGGPAIPGVVAPGAKPGTAAANADPLGLLK